MYMYLSFTSVNKASNVKISAVNGIQYYLPSYENLT